MKDVEIGAFGETKVYMRLNDLFRIANKEAQDFADIVCRDNSRLQYELDSATEALNKIFKRAKETKKDGFSEYVRRVCQNVLKDIEE